MSKWDAYLDDIRDAIIDGQTAVEIAYSINTTAANLHKICHRNGIRIPRPGKYAKSLPPIADMARALRAAGYTVTGPEL